MRAQILARIDDATPSQRRIARYLLDGYPIAGLDSLAAIGQRCHVNSSTVLRYVQSLGYSSHYDFREALRGERATRHSPAPAHADADPAEALVESVTLTVRGMADGALPAVVELLAQSRRRVLCVGGAFSHVLADFLWDHLRVLRPGVSILEPNATLPEVVQAVRRSDVAVVFDYSPYTARTLELARAVARTATVVAVTDPQLSPVAEVADHVLVTHVTGIGSFDSYAPAIAALELVVTSVERRLGESVRRRVLAERARLRR